MAAFYGSAGINHFRNPSGYEKIIPPFFSDPVLINITAGIAEMILALLLLIPGTRRFACYSIMLMLIAFIPVHIYMLKTGYCVDQFCFPMWALWLRLLVLQPLLVFWAYKQSK